MWPLRFGRSCKVSRFPKPYSDVVQRLRVPAGFLLLVSFAFLAEPTTRSIASALPVILAGLLLRAWAAGHLRKDTTLTDSGPYAYTRNPLYLGSFVAAMGFAWGGRSWVLGLIFAAVFVLIYLPVMELEEQHLRQLFEGYGAYAQRVPLLIPKPGPGGTRRFDWAAYLKNQEYKAALGLLVGVAVLLWKALQ
jgi:protein-S-isoprenylcysteine O-methyltransferase Ste14